MSDSAREMLAGLPRAFRFAVPDDVAALVADRGRALGADNITVYLADHEQYLLVPLPTHDDAGRQPLNIDSTLAGRCFRHLSIQWAHARQQVWVPLLDGSERVGVVHVEFPLEGERATFEELDAFGAMIAEVLMVKQAYGDLFARVRRRQPMTLAAEIAWNLLPPLTFGTDRLVISCVLAPAYKVGGDSFDYAVDATTARFAVFDAMGHGLNAGWLATIAIGAYRNARRGGCDLMATVEAIDGAVMETFGGEEFVTGVLAELDLGSGHLRWHLAGHPAPLLLRDGRVVKTRPADPGLPLGLSAALGVPPTVWEQQLEPGDRLLLFTDGVIEARAADGTFFGTDRLVDFVVRQSANRLPTPELMRRLMHAILAHQAGQLQDDATTMLVEWQVSGSRRITGSRPLPATMERMSPPLARGQVSGAVTLRPKS